MTQSEIKEHCKELAVKYLGRIFHNHKTGIDECLDILELACEFDLSTKQEWHDDLLTEFPEHEKEIKEVYGKESFTEKLLPICNFKSECDLANGKYCTSTEICDYKLEF